jgi:dihydrofolate reductase
VVDSIEKAFEFVPEDENAFIIGGGEIYKQSLEYADVIELTRVHGSFDADTYFPEINPDHWELIEEEYHPKDEKHLVDFTYQTYIRK